MDVIGIITGPEAVAGYPDGSGRPKILEGRKACDANRECGKDEIASH